MQPSHLSTENCQTKFDEIAGAYIKSGQPFFQNTRGNHSVQAVQWDIIGVDLANARAIARAVKGQTLSFFSYGLTSVIALAGDPNFRATEAETNIAKANETNNTDFAIEAVSVCHRGNKVSYVGNPFTDTDPDLILAMQGMRPIVDPFSQRLPAQAGSPALLESAMFQMLTPFLSLRFEWDNGVRTEKVGVLNQFGEGGGASFLHANGVPSQRDRAMIPEGYAWTRAGQAGSQFTAISVLTQTIYCPIDLVTLPGTTAGIAPDHIYTEIMLRLGGTQFGTPSSN